MKLSVYTLTAVLLTSSTCQAWLPVRQPGRRFSSFLAQSSVAEAPTAVNVATASKDTEEWKRQKTLLRRYTEQALSGNRLSAAVDATQVLQNWQGTVAPTTLSYNAVLNAWKALAASNPRDHWDQAVAACENILQDMQNRQLADICSYTTFLSLLAIKGNASAARHASQVFDNLPLPPNGRTLNAVLLAWTNAGQVDKAAQLLQQWEQDETTASQLTTASYATL